MVLPRVNRLRRRQEFKDVYQSGRRRTGHQMTVRAHRQYGRASDTPRRPALAVEDRPATRSGISISQKVSKKAVVRNRIKRQIKAALRQLLPRILPGWLVVVVVRPDACKCDYVEILRELEELLAEAEVLDGHSRGNLL